MNAKYYKSRLLSEIFFRSKKENPVKCVRAYIHTESDFTETEFNFYKNIL